MRIHTPESLALNLPARMTPNVRDINDFGLHANVGPRGVHAYPVDWQYIFGPRMPRLNRSGHTSKRQPRQVYNGLVYDLLACDSEERPLAIRHLGVPEYTGRPGSESTAVGDWCNDGVGGERAPTTRASSRGSVEVVGLSRHPVRSAGHVMDLLAQGERLLRIRSTEVQATTRTE